MRRGAVLAIVVAVLAVAAAPAPAAVQLTSIGSFSAPIYVTAPPGDLSRVFVVGRAGSIQVIDDGVKKEFLNIVPLVQTGGERGLLSMAFASDYATSGKFYVFYIQKTTNHVRIEQFQRSASDPDKADAGSSQLILDVSHDMPNHNGGQLQVGLDGTLWATIGDNANGANSQTLSNVYGKLLRIDPATTLGPPDNPFIGVGGADGRIFALGLRNTWRFSFDRSTDQLVLADVGQSTWEEIDIGHGGANYGWPTCEGTCGNPSFTNPVLQYPHTADACSGAITGGYVVRTDDLPSLAGRYLYGDYCSGFIRSTVLAEPSASDDRSEGLNVTGLVSFGEDACGHLYTVSELGTVSRVSEESPPPTCAESSVKPLPPAVQPAPEPTPPEPGPQPPALRDVIAPKLSMSFRKRQRVLRTRRLVVAAGCDEPCTLKLTATFTGTGARRAPTAALVKHTLRLNRRAAARIRAALRRHRRVVAVVKITGKDTAGNGAMPATIRIRITG